MVSHAVQPDVGVVGAKLYYPNDTIQHVGVILGIHGLAGHAFKGNIRSSPGYFGRAKLLHDCSAVTGACMLFRRDVFDEVGEFDEVNLAIAFNDVDFCLRVRERGYRIVMTPFAELYHHESASRGSDETQLTRPRFLRESTYLKERWKDRLLNDPFYSPNLTLENEVFSLAFPSRAPKPWRNNRPAVKQLTQDA
jgi:GT2 family glycosyltransferase